MITVGEVGTGKPVDKWHTDSVDYVMVIILSDLTDMVGGELAVLQMPDASGVTFQKLVTEGIPQELVEITKYAGPGYCIFMQGSKILHTVNAVLSAREPRLSLVNSYMSLNPFKKDYTKFNTFGPKGFADRDDIRTVEYARHKAWRAQGQLQYLMDNVKFGAKNEDIISFLRLAAAELVIAAERIGGLDDDNAYWVEENKDNANTTTPLSKI